MKSSSYHLPIPDRLACGDADDKHVNNELANFLNLYLDGVKQQWGIEYCISEGWIIRTLVINGNIKLDSVGRCYTEKVFGKVEVFRK
jgi:hypothetical protein